MTKKNGKYKDLKINLLISFTTVLLFFLVFEIILRLFWEEPGPGGYPLGLYQPDDLLGFKHVSNFTGYYPSLSYKDIEITINSKGLRDKEYEYEKNSGTIRILGLGDSVTFGVGIKEEDTFLAVLESKLNNNSKPVEVINAGIASYTSHHEFKYFYRDLVKYDADVVILNVAINDLNYHNIEKLKKEYAKDKPLLSHFGLPQYLVGRLCKTCKILYHSANNAYYSIEKNAEKFNSDYFSYINIEWSGNNFELFEDDLIKLDDYLKANDKKLLVAIYPVAQQYSTDFEDSNYPQKRLKELCNQSNIDFIDLYKYFEKDKYKSYYLPFDKAHFNKLGNEVISEVLYLKLESMGVLNN